MSSTTSILKNIHVSKHPCLKAKLSQLRSKSRTPREIKTLVHEIALIIGCEALAMGLEVTTSGTDESPLGLSYDIEIVQPAHISLVPILRSGLGMTEALQTLLPDSVPVQHLGLFREPTTLQPVEYYNNLPYHSLPSPNHLAILVDPVIATGGTCVAAIQTLREWGVSRIIVVSVLGSENGLERAASEWEDGVEIWVGGVDKNLNERGMITPGLGDIGDRLFGTKGK